MLDAQWTHLIGEMQLLDGLALDDGLRERHQRAASQVVGLDVQHS